MKRKGYFKNACRIKMLMGLSNLFSADCYEARNRSVVDPYHGDANGLVGMIASKIAK